MRVKYQVILFSHQNCFFNTSRNYWHDTSLLLTITTTVISKNKWLGYRLDKKVRGVLRRSLLQLPAPAGAALRSPQAAQVLCSWGLKMPKGGDHITSLATLSPDFPVLRRKDFPYVQSESTSFCLNHIASQYFGQSIFDPSHKIIVRLLTISNLHSTLLYSVKCSTFHWR